MRGVESRMPVKETQVGMFVDSLLRPAAKRCDHLIFLRHNRPEVGSHIFRACSPAGGVSRVMRHLRPVNHCFRGCTSSVDAGSTQVPFLDEGDLPAKFRESHRQRYATLAGADYNRIVMHWTNLRFAGGTGFSLSVFFHPP